MIIIIFWSVVFTLRNIKIRWIPVKREKNHFQYENCFLIWFSYRISTLCESIFWDFILKHSRQFQSSESIFSFQRSFPLSMSCALFLNGIEKWEQKAVRKIFWKCYYSERKWPNAWKIENKLSEHVPPYIVAEYFKSILIFVVFSVPSFFILSCYVFEPYHHNKIKSSHRQFN